MEMDKVISQGLERLLGEFGLERRRTTSDLVLPAIGAFAAGAVVGGLLGLLLAPSSGRELRTELDKKLRGEPPRDNSIPTRV